MMTSASDIARYRPARCSAGYTLEHAHVLPVGPWKLQQRRSAREPRQYRRSRISGEHESGLRLRESLEPCYCAVERQLPAEIERRVEEGRIAGNYAFIHRHSVKRCPRVYPKSDCNIYRVAGGQPPFRELQRFFEGARSLAWAAYEENP